MSVPRRDRSNANGMFVSVSAQVRSIANDTVGHVQEDLYVWTFPLNDSPGLWTVVFFAKSRLCSQEGFYLDHNAVLLEGERNQRD